MLSSTGPLYFFTNALELFLLLLFLEKFCKCVSSFQKVSRTLGTVPRTGPEHTCICHNGAETVLYLCSFPMHFNLIPMQSKVRTSYHALNLEFKIDER